MENNNTGMTLEEALASAKESAQSKEVVENTIPPIKEEVIPSTVVVQGSEIETDKTVVTGNPNPDESIANLETFSNKMDEEVAEAKKLFDSKTAEEVNNNSFAERKTSKNEFKDNIIVIDDEEIASIKEEIGEPIVKSNVDVSSITIKKSKKLTEDEIMKRFVKKVTESNPSTRIVAVNSGYAASMDGFSSPALRNVSAELAQYDKDFGATDYRYRLVHSKIKDTTIGSMDYMTFLKNTSLLELDIFFYGIVCSTYPDKNQFPGKCPNPKCEAKFKYDYFNKDYLKVTSENVDEVTEKVAALLKGQAINPEEIFENAPTNMVTREILDDSGIIVELRHPTLYDHLYDVLQTLEDKNSSLINSMPFIETVLIPDIDIEGNTSYFKLEKVENKLNTLEQLSEADDIKLAEKIKIIIDQSNIEFAMQNIECPYCKHKFADQIVSMEQMLFTIHQIKITNK